IRKDRQSLRNIHAHDLGSRGTRHHIPAVFRLPGERRAKVGHKALVCGRDERYGGLLRAKQLPVGVQVTFARVRTWYEIRMRAGWQDPEDLDLATFRARDRFRALQTFQRLARWGHIAVICIEKAEHVIE